MTAATARQDVSTQKKTSGHFPSPVEYDVCIAGAGVAGSALAWYLGRRGVSVAVVERDFSEPEKIIGELLQPGGVMKLAELGYRDVLDGLDAQLIEGYALFLGNSHFEIPYPEIGGTRLPGRGFRYGKFVSKLRQCLQGLPGVSLIEGSANELLENKDTGKVTGIRYFSKNEGRESEIHARLTVICDGGFSKFRDKLNSSPRQVRGYMLGLLLKNAHLPYPRHGHVFLGGATPFLSYPVSSTETRVLIDFPGEQSPKKDGIFRSYLRETVFRQLPQSMRQAYIRALEEDKFKAMPNVMAASKPVRKGGVILLGDSLNMRHPLTGGGMTVALTDVHLIGDLLSGVGNFKKEEELNKAIEEFYRRRHSENASINILADALYDVMSHPELKQVCFDYLKRGGRYVKAPISILSAVSRDKDVLLRKFFSVAIWGAGKKLLPFPTPKRIAQSFRLIGEAVHIISPLLMNENPSGTLKTMIQAGKWIFPQVNSRNLSAS